MSSTGPTGSNVSNGSGSTLGSMPVNNGQSGGRRHRGASVKTLKKMLKKHGLKTTGKKATLTRRAKKAHLKMRGGDANCGPGQVYDTASRSCVIETTGGKRKKSRSRGILGKLF